MMLSREGQSVGINLIVTGSQASSIGFRLLANYSNRIATIATRSRNTTICWSAAG